MCGSIAGWLNCSPLVPPGPRHMGPGRRVIPGERGNKSELARRAEPPDEIVPITSVSMCVQEGCVGSVWQPSTASPCVQTATIEPGTPDCQNGEEEEGGGLRDGGMKR